MGVLPLAEGGVNTRHDKQALHHAHVNYTAKSAECDRLLKENERLRDALERIANSVTIGAESKQLNSRIRSIFQCIAGEALAALK